MENEIQQCERKTNVVLPIRRSLSEKIQQCCSASAKRTLYRVQTFQESKIARFNSINRTTSIDILKSSFSLKSFSPYRLFTKKFLEENVAVEVEDYESIHLEEVLEIDAARNRLMSSFLNVLESQQRLDAYREDQKIRRNRDRNVVVSNGVHYRRARRRRYRSSLEEQTSKRNIFHSWFLSIFPSCGNKLTLLA